MGSSEERDGEQGVELEVEGSDDDDDGAVDE